MSRLKRLAGLAVDRYVVPRLVRSLSTLVDGIVEEKIRSRASYQPADQLFYDVSNFIVFNQIPGDYLEFGVWEGESFAAMYRHLSQQWHEYEGHAQRFGHSYDPDFWPNKRFVAFDSFQGLPGSTEVETPSHYAAGVYRAEKEVFSRNIAAHGVDLAKVSVVAGWYDEVLTPTAAAQAGLNEACIVYIDCDVYESAVPVFSFITDLIQDGTVLIMDDFFRYRADPRRGVQGAYNQWLESTPNIQTSELTRCWGNRVALVCHVEASDLSLTDGQAKDDAT